jgi:hypothetical protein
MREKTNAQLEEAMNNGELSPGEYYAIIEAKRENNRAKQRKYRDKIKNSRHSLTSSSALRRLDVLIPSGIIEGLKELGRSNEINQRTLVELALVQFLTRNGTHDLYYASEDVCNLIGVEARSNDISSRGVAASVRINRRLPHVRDDEKQFTMNLLKSFL